MRSLVFLFWTWEKVEEVMIWTGWYRFLVWQVWWWCFCLLVFSKKKVSRKIVVLLSLSLFRSPSSTLSLVLYCVIIAGKFWGLSDSRDKFCSIVAQVFLHPLKLSLSPNSNSLFSLTASTPRSSSSRASPTPQPPERRAPPRPCPPRRRRRPRGPPAWPAARRAPCAAGRLARACG